MPKARRGKKDSEPEYAGKETDGNNSAGIELHKHSHSLSDLPVTGLTKTTITSHLISLIAAFLTENGFKRTSKAFAREREDTLHFNGASGGLIAESEGRFPGLLEIYAEWHDQHYVKGIPNGKPGKVVRPSNSAEDSESIASSPVRAGSSGDRGKGKKRELHVPTKKTVQRSPGTTDDTSSPSSSNFSDAESSISTSSADKRKQRTTKPTKDVASPRVAPYGRMEIEEPSSESSSSSSDSSNSEDEPERGRLRIRENEAGTKVKPAALDSVVAMSKHMSPPKKSTGTTKITNPNWRSTAESETSSSSESESSIDEVTEGDKLSSLAKASVSAAAKADTRSRKPVKPNGQTVSDAQSSLEVTSSPSVSGNTVESSTETETESESESESELVPHGKPLVAKDTKKDVKQVSKSTKRKRSSSPTASGNSSPPKKLRPASTNSGVTNGIKSQNKPFSRIPPNVKVDKKFASNAYVPNEYAERAHKDLSVTKGKGFTKEKNKKKRGSYRGGAIDVEGRKGIKFD